MVNFLPVVYLQIRCNLKLIWRALAESRFTLSNEDVRSTFFKSRSTFIY